MKKRESALRQMTHEEALDLVPELSLRPEFRRQVAIFAGYLHVASRSSGFSDLLDWVSRYVATDDTGRLATGVLDWATIASDAKRPEAATHEVALKLEEGRGGAYRGMLELLAAERALPKRGESWEPAVGHLVRRGYTFDFIEEFWGYPAFLQSRFYLVEPWPLRGDLRAAYGLVPPRPGE